MKKAVLLFYLILTSILVQGQTSERLKSLSKDDNYFKSILGNRNANKKSLIFSDPLLHRFAWYSAKEKHPWFAGSKVEKVEYLIINDTISIISIHFRNPDEVVSVKKYLATLYGPSSDFPESELEDEDLRADKI